MKTPLRRGSRSITYCSGHDGADLVYEINYCCLRVRSGLGSDLFCYVCAKVELASASASGGGGGMDSSPSVRPFPFAAVFPFEKCLSGHLWNTLLSADTLGTSHILRLQWEGGKECPNII